MSDTKEAKLHNNEALRSITMRSLNVQSSRYVAGKYIALLWIVLICMKTGIYLYQLQEAEDGEPDLGIVDDE